MIEIQCNNFVGEHLSDAVLITGLPRSGTTISGKLLGSFTEIEYAFEPPLVPYLDAKARHDLLSEEIVAELLKVYLYYDYFSNYVHGRRYNFRPGDSSYVLGMKTVPEILEQWDRVANMQDALDVTPEYRFCLKSPGTYHAQSALIEAFPEISIVEIVRNLDRVVASLVDKRWFYGKNLGQDSTGLWPFHEFDGEFLVPYLVESGDKEAWQTMSPETRTVYICNRLAEDRLAFEEQFSNRDNYTKIRYENLKEDPEKVAKELSKKLGVSWGAMSDNVVDEIEPTKAPSEIESILNSCSNSVRKRYEELRPKFDP